MKDTNLISLLKTFSKEEMKQFGKFVRSPFFNTQTGIIRYYNVLRKYYPFFNQKGFTKENIFNVVYPGRKYSGNEILKLNSQMYHLCIEFFKHLPGNIFDEYKVMDELVSRNMDKQFISRYKKFSDYIDNEVELDNFVFTYKIYPETYFIRHYLKKDQQKHICQNVIKRGDYFVYQSLLWIIIQYRDMLVNYEAYNYPYEDCLANKFIHSLELEKLVSKIEYEDNRLGRYMKYYITCLLMVMYPDKELYFEQFKLSFRNIFNEVNRLERSNYLARMQSYVLFHMHRGNTKYLDELLNTYRFYFDQKGIFESEIIPMPPFRNCITFALLANDLDFVMELTKLYSTRIYAAYRDDTVKLGYAYYYFASKNYDMVLDYLRKFSYKYPQHKLDVKQLILKVYYETEKYESLYSLIDSFKHFLNNNKSISDLNKKRYRNLLHYTQQLTSVKLDENKLEVNQLKDEILFSKNELLIQDKHWLLEKIKEFPV